MVKGDADEHEPEHESDANPDEVLALHTAERPSDGRRSVDNVAVGAGARSDRKRSEYPPCRSAAVFPARNGVNVCVWPSGFTLEVCLRVRTEPDLFAGKNHARVDSFNHVSSDHT